MTLNELLTSTKPLVTPAEISPILNMHPQTINLMARDGSLPFPYLRSGNRTKIPRLQLLAWLGFPNDTTNTKEAKNGHSGPDHG